jgi:hypothetical protein
VTSSGDTVKALLSPIRVRRHSCSGSGDRTFEAGSRRMMGAQVGGRDDVPHREGESDDMVNVDVEAVVDHAPVQSINAWTSPGVRATVRGWFSPGLRKGTV